MLKVALLDMYRGEPNRGIPMLRSILAGYGGVLRFDEFDVRLAGQLPDMDYHIYLFSGGPGDPLCADGEWFNPFFSLIESLWTWNNTCVEKKYVFFICHSFQMACHHFQVGTVTQRYKMSFGTYPVHKTAFGKSEVCFEGLPDPFYIADFRRYQVIRPQEERLRELGAKILCLEKLRPHVHLERAIMAIRFSPWMLGTQFHPEADPGGLLLYFREPERRASIEEEHGGARYDRMIRDLAHPGKIQRTFQTVLPRFLDQAVEALIPSMVPA
jgi:GMP synthase-like glutamine amidotransferase